MGGSWTVCRFKRGLGKRRGLGGGVIRQYPMHTMIRFQTYQLYLVYQLFFWSYWHIIKTTTCKNYQSLNLKCLLCYLKNNFDIGFFLESLLNSKGKSFCITVWISISSTPIMAGNVTIFFDSSALWPGLKLVKLSLVKLVN